MKIKLKEEIKTTDFNSIDYQKFKMGAESLLDDSWKIESNSFLSNEILKLLLDYVKSGKSIEPLFKKYSEKHKKPEYNYLVKIICTKCGKETYKTLNKSGVLYFINHGCKTMCDDCCTKEFEEQQKEKLIEEEKREIEETERTEKQVQEYIETYLNPNNKWNPNVPIKNRYYQIFNKFKLHGYTIVNYIKEMNYYDFLETPYWKAIAAYVKQKRGFKCQLCGSGLNLAVHHRTYENHGYEHCYNVMNTDLIVLCKNCHSKFHDII